jgi:hypothetical protein
MRLRGRPPDETISLVEYMKHLGLRSNYPVKLIAAETGNSILFALNQNPKWKFCLLSLATRRG